jgi:hypothetical protein
MAVTGFLGFLTGTEETPGAVEEISNILEVMQWQPNKK